MSKLFISYRRKSWGFTHRLADELRQRLDAEVFVDVDSIDQTDFEKAIVNHLRQSDAVLLVVSETTFIDRIHRDDDWVRREIREALTRGLPLVMVCVDGLLPPSGLPDDIKDIARMQGVNFYPDYFVPAVEKLADFVTKVSPLQRKGKKISLASSVIQTSSTSIVESTYSDMETHKQMLSLLNEGDFNKAIFFYENARNNGYKPRVNIDGLLKNAYEKQSEEKRRREASLDYLEIVEFLKYDFSYLHGIAEFKEWSNKYPDLVSELDTQNIRKSPFIGHPKPVDEVSLTSSANKKRIYTSGELITASILNEENISITSLALMPKPFGWINVPGKNGKDWKGKSFAIAKYPVTNEQYRLFVEAGGYQEQKWWTESGWIACEKEKWLEPRFWDDEKWNKSDYPVVRVSWYEAIAFCIWLSELTGEKISLPTDEQWKYAAQGDDKRAFPWGNLWECANCNSLVEPCKSDRTTPVRQYEGKGDSPFGVVDMAGNVWEWCLTAYETKSNGIDGIDDRMVRGGSWGNKKSNWFRCDFDQGVKARVAFNVRGFRIVRN